MNRTPPPHSPASRSRRGRRRCSPPSAARPSAGTAEAPVERPLLALCLTACEANRLRRRHDTRSFPKASVRPTSARGWGTPMTRLAALPR
jgi:hypothetical protein